VSGFLHDLRYAVRNLRKSPGFTAVAVLTIALGIGPTTAIFTLVDSVLLRPLPGRDPARLVNVHRTEPDGTTFQGFSHPNYLDLRRQTRRLQGLAAFTGRFVSLRRETGAVPVAAQIVSENYFDLLGVSPARGRAFDASEARGPESTPVAILGDRLWRRQFAADPGLVGQTIVVNGHPFTVVGILRPGFDGAFVGFKFDLWLPLSAAAWAAPGLDRDDRADDSLELIGRLAPGTSRAEAQAELAGLSRSLARDFPNENRGMGVDVRPATPVDDSLRRVVTTLFALLSGVSGLVLLIACVNVSSLLLARNLSRSREFAIRRAIGADRSDLLRLTFTETLLLFLAGGGSGFLASFGLCRILASFTPRFAIPLELDLRPDYRSFGFAFAVAVFSALAFGLAPGLVRAPTALAAVLREGSRASSPQRARRLFVAVELALSTVLLVGAGLLVRSIEAIRSAPPGFDASGVRMSTLNLGLISRDPASGAAFYRGLLARVEALPGVASAALAQRVPMGGIGKSTERIRIPGQASASPESEGLAVETNTVSPGFFPTLSIPILAGRNFRSSDADPSASVAIVNETLARRLGTGGDAVGRTFRLGAREVRIVGVVGNGRYRSLGEPAQFAAYFPFGSRFFARMTFLIRGPSAAANDLDAAFRREVTARNPDLPVLDTMALSDFLAVASLPQRMAGAVTTALGLLGLLLASIGLYGLLAFEIGQRRREIGIRMALGARPSAIASLFLLRGARLIAGGAGAGLALALGASQLLESLLFGVAPRDPFVFGAVAASLAAVALLATYVPARRAANVDPIVALRTDG
jgi:predicted permease